MNPVFLTAFRTFFIDFGLSNALGANWAPFRPRTAAACRASTEWIDSAALTSAPG